MSDHAEKNARPLNQGSRWLHRDTKPRTRGQALVEYVLILALVVIALIAVLTITGPAVGNVFSNTVYNLLGGTIEPRDTMAADDFWTQVAAVASYTPENPGLITNTPAPPTNTYTPGPSPTATDITPSPIPTNTPTPGPSPTPPTQNWGYPFDDPSNNPDNWKPNFDDLILNHWSGEYWNYSAFGWRNNMSAMPDGSGLVNKDLVDLNFYYPSGTTPDPAVQENFYARFKTSVTLEAKEYTLRIRRDNGVRVWVGGVLVVDQNVPDSGDPATWVDWSSDQIKDNWFERRFTATAGDQQVVVEYVDTSGGARLTLALLDLGAPPTVGTWNAEYWNYGTFGWRTDMSAMTSANRRYATTYPALDLHFNSGVRPNAAVTENFYARFKTTITFENKTYAFNILRDAGVRIWVGGKIVVNQDVPNAGDPATWVIESADSIGLVWFERVFTPDPGPQQVIVEWVDTTGAADLHVELHEALVTPEGTCNWALSSEQYFSSPTAWSDSPGTSYAPGSLCILELRGTIDLTGATNPQLEFYDRYNLAANTVARVGIAEEGTTAWVDVDLHNYSTDLGWTREVLDLTDVNGRDFTGKRILLRFILDARNASTGYDGWWIDNVLVEDHIDRVYTIGFSDSMEGSLHWYPNGSWTRSNEAAHSPQNAWSDSAGQNYVNGTNSVLELDGYIDLTGAAVSDPELTFWQRYNIASDDTIYVEISLGDRDHWQNLIPSTTGVNLSWSQKIISLAPYVGETFYFRFRLDATYGSSVSDGWWIDDFTIRNKPSSFIFPNWCDDMETGGSNWTPEGTWGSINGSDINGSQTILPYNGIGFWSDSPGRNYQDATDSSLILAPTLNLSTSTNPEIVFWHQWDLASAERISVEISTDGGVSWSAPWSFNYGDSRPPGYSSSTVRRGYNTNLGWTRDVVSLESYVGQNINIRFRLDARTDTTVSDGWWIDQVCFQEHNEPVRNVGFSDGFESGAGNWYVGGEWAISSENVLTSPGVAFSDSPGRQYKHLSNSILELKGVVNLTGTVKPTLYYWDRFNLANDDYALVEINVSDDSGATWTGWTNISAVQRRNTTTLSWDREQVNLSSYIPTVSNPNRVVRIRFRLYAVVNSAVGDGWWIDNVSIVDRNGVEPIFSLPFTEDAESVNTRWVFDHTWTRIPFYRMLGSGNALSPGAWTGEYFYDANTNRRLDSGELYFTIHNLPEVDFDWGSGRPTPTEGGTPLPSSNNFMVRFTRTIYVTSDNVRYDIETRSDDGIRLIVDPPGTPATSPTYPNSWPWTINAWSDRGFNTDTPDTASVILSQGVHTIIVEFYDSGGSARVKVDFAKDGKVFQDSVDQSTPYIVQANMSMTLEGMIDLTGTTNPTLSLWHRDLLSSGSTCNVDISTDGGFSWSNKISFGSYNTLWQQVFVDLSSSAGQQINIRFRTDSRGSSSGDDGCYVDDIVVAE